MRKDENLARNICSSIYRCDFELCDKPDLQNNELSIGIEVTSAFSSYYMEYQNSNNLSKRTKEVIKNSEVTNINKTKPVVTSGQAMIDLEKIYLQKLNKYNTYTVFNKMVLFIFTSPFSLFDYSLEYVLTTFNRYKKCYNEIILYSNTSKYCKRFKLEKDSYKLAESISFD